MNSTDTLLTRQQAAEFLTVRPQTLAVWAMTCKHVPYIKLGKAVRYRLSDLEAFVEQQTFEPPVETDRHECGDRPGRKEEAAGETGDVMEDTRTSSWRIDGRREVTAT